MFRSNQKLISFVVLHFLIIFRFNFGVVVLSILYHWKVIPQIPSDCFSFVIQPFPLVTIENHKNNNWRPLSSSGNQAFTIKQKRLYVFIQHCSHFPGHFLIASRLYASGENGKRNSIILFEEEKEVPSGDFHSSPLPDTRSAQITTLVFLALFAIVGALSLTFTNCS